MSEIGNNDPELLKPAVSKFDLEGDLKADMNVGELQQTSETTLMKKDSSLQKHVSFNRFAPVDYLKHIESSIPPELISPENYKTICHLASFFNENITSFFGFETRLHKTDGCADYLFAISSKKGEREALLKLLKEKQLPPSYHQHKDWKQIETFTESWCNPISILHKKVLGLWFEFDTAYKEPDVFVPGLFVQIKPIIKTDTGIVEDFSWINNELFPALTGKTLSEKNIDMINQSIQNLPDKSILLFVAAMISRETSTIRTTIKMNYNQIVPYLKSLGWKDKDDGLQQLLNEVHQHSSRIILHLDIGEEINPKIGLECSFAPDLYHYEVRWVDFFEYLIDKGACLPEKKKQILSFMGVDLKDDTSKFNLESFFPAVKFNDGNYSGALVRYLSHFKIQYLPGKPIAAKAYPGVRLFGKK